MVVHKPVLMCVLEFVQACQLKAIVSEIDPDALFISEVHRAIGERLLSHLKLWKANIRKNLVIKRRPVKAAHVRVRIER